MNDRFFSTVRVVFLLIAVVLGASVSDILSLVRLYGVDTGAIRGLVSPLGALSVYVAFDVILLCVLVQGIYLAVALSGRAGGDRELFGAHDLTSKYV